MSDQQWQDLLPRLGSDDWETAMQAAPEVGRLSAEGDMNALQFALTISAKEYGSGVANAVTDGIIENAPATIAPLLRVLREDAFRETAGMAAYCLGEIAYRQGKERDPRILPAALDLFRSARETQPDFARAAISMLRQCAFAGPVPEASAAASTFIERERARPEPRWWDVQRAMEILFANRGPAYLDELRTERADLANDHPFAEIIDDYLRTKAEGEALP
jgi:hypothetical protein